MGDCPDYAFGVGENAMNSYRLAVTPGEPAGVGPDVCLQLLQEMQEMPEMPGGVELVLFADRGMVEERAGMLGVPLEVSEYVVGAGAEEGAGAVKGMGAGKEKKKGQGGGEAQVAGKAQAAGEAQGAGKAQAKAGGKARVCIAQVDLARRVKVGELCGGNGGYVLEALRLAVGAVQSGELDALVTGPVHKGVINEAGFEFLGHTEFLAELCGVETPVMMLATAGLRVALATTHLPLAEVAEAITEPGLERVIRVLHGEMKKKFGINEPRILVCGLNPHAGEGGHLGREEVETIIPLLKRLQKEGMKLQGPLPADTVFTDKYLQRADVVLAMYHDQGLPVLKFKGFGAASNITLGLPFIRTSVDHGTALDIAGSGKADVGSLRHAVVTACEMIEATRR